VQHFELNGIILPLTEHCEPLLGSFTLGGDGMGAGSRLITAAFLWEVITSFTRWRSDFGGAGVACIAVTG
jgi:hypothetical protein